MAEILLGILIGVGLIFAFIYRDKVKVWVQQAIAKLKTLRSDKTKNDDNSYSDHQNYKY
jgi:hypothetical protein